MEKLIENADFKQKRHLLDRPFVYKLGIGSIGFFPTWLSYGFAEKIAALSYIFCSQARENVKKNLRNVFPKISNKELSSMALRTFKNYSNFLVDYGRFSSLDRESMFKVIKYIDGEENIRKSIKKNKGIILLTGHLGNWELGGMYFGKQNIKINVLTFRDEMANIHEIRTRYRKFHNIDTIAVGESPFSSIEIINALQRNEVVALLVDRYGKTGGMAVKFFGKPAYFPLGPVILAKISGAPIIPAFVVKVDKKSFRVIVEKPIEVPSNIDKEIGPYLQKIVNVFEKVIKEYPDQWYNFAPI